MVQCDKGIKPAKLVLTMWDVLSVLISDHVQYTIFALIDHSPVGRIHSEEWA